MATSRKRSTPATKKDPAKKPSSLERKVKDLGEQVELLTEIVVERLNVDLVEYRAEQERTREAGAAQELARVEAEEAAAEAAL